MRRLIGAGSITTVLMVFCGLALLYSLPSLGRAALLWWRNGSLEDSLEQVSEALVQSLCHAALLSTERNDIIGVQLALSGRMQVHIGGTSRSEERLFLAARAEVLGPLQNPRYLLVRESGLWRRRQIDFHAVSTALGTRKDLAEHFHSEWCRRVGSSQLVYNRNAKGRLTLLRARVRSSAAGTQRFFEQRSVWM